MKELTLEQKRNVVSKRLYPPYPDESDKDREARESIRTLTDEQINQIYSLIYQEEQQKKITKVIHVELLPCPFCAPTEKLNLFWPRLVANDEQTDFWVQCSCGATCGKCKTPEIAVETWNHRYFCLPKP